MIVWTGNPNDHVAFGLWGGGGGWSRPFWSNLIRRLACLFWAGLIRGLIELFRPGLVRLHAMLLAWFGRYRYHWMSFGWFSCTIGLNKSGYPVNIFFISPQ